MSSSSSSKSDRELDDLSLQELQTYIHTARLNPNGTREELIDRLELFTRLHDMQVKELKQVAATLNVDVSKDKKKEDIRSSIRIHLQTNYLPELPQNVVSQIAKAATKSTYLNAPKDVDKIKQISKAASNGELLHQKLRVALAMKDAIGLRELKTLLQPSHMNVRTEKDFRYTKEPFDHNKVQRLLKEHSSGKTKIERIVLENDYVSLSVLPRTKSCLAFIEFNSTYILSSLDPFIEFHLSWSDIDVQKAGINGMKAIIAYHPDFDYKNNRDILLGVQWLKRYFFPKLFIDKAFDENIVAHSFGFGRGSPQVRDFPQFNLKEKESQAYIKELLPVIRKIVRSGL
jgi:hypothetical protein